MYPENTIPIEKLRSETRKLEIPKKTDEKPYYSADALKSLQQPVVRARLALDDLYRKLDQYAGLIAQVEYPFTRHVLSREGQDSFSDALTEVKLQISRFERLYPLQRNSRHRARPKVETGEGAK